MNKYQEIRCIKLDRTMTVGKCLRLQDEAITTFGADKVGKCSTCPCDQGRKIRGEIAMAQNKRRECRNCKRIMVISQDGLCGGCWNRTKGKTGDEKEKALDLAREQFGGLPPGKRAPQKPYTKGPRVKPANNAVIVDDMDGSEQQTETEKEWMRQVNAGAAMLPDPGAVPVPDHPGLNEVPLLSVIINFSDGDGPLFDGLLKLGKKYRRSPDQQLLWLLEKELSNEVLIKDDSGRTL